MKKIKLMVRVIISLTAAGIIPGMPASAQFKKGTLVLGTTLGSTAYSDANSDYNFDNGSTRSTSTHTYTLGIGPQVGVFISSSVVLGGTLSFNLNNSHGKTTNNSPNTTSSGSSNVTTTTVGMLEPFLRYYFAGSPQKNWFYMQVHGGAGTGTGSSSGSGYTATATSTTYGKVNSIFNWDTGFSLGMTHFFYHRLGMDLSLGYTYGHSHSYNANTIYTTNERTGALSSSTSNYILNTGTNGIAFNIGFNRFF
jgi:hypothetical protein